MNRFVIICIATIGLGWCPIAAAQTELSAVGARLVPIAPAWAGNSVNAAIFRRNSIASHDGIQFASFYNQQGQVVLAKRSLEDTKWEILTTQYSGIVRNAHNAISIAVDGKGFVHAAWDHHTIPLRYARSVEPGSVKLGDKIPMTGQHETRITYPEFYNMPDGGLLCIYRDGASGGGNLVMNRYDVQSGTWRQLHASLIDGERARNAYWQAAVDQKGTIHLSWVWRETSDVATNHDLCYAKSIDGGESWLKSTGEKYSLPINAANAEYAVRIPQRHELINQTSMTTDSKQRPYIATYWRDEGTDVPQYHVVHHDGTAWRTSSLGLQTIPFRLGGTGTKRIPISRPQILADSTGTTDKAWLLFRDEGRGNKVSVAICDDLAKPQWRVQDLTNTSVGQWEPSYDTALWQSRKMLHLFVQRVEQRDGEGVSDVPPEMVYVLEWKP